VVSRGMARETLTQLLEVVEEHIARLTEHADRQRELVARLEELGQPSDDARTALKAFEEELILQESERARILTELSCLPPN
jgi:predicted nuclease with TOPRIM domain